MNHPTPARLEAFSDGVIAVIITIMVLELHVPHASGWAGLRSLLPTLAIYLLSFLFTGIYWVNHHHLIDRLERAGPLILWANLSLLFALSLLPFFTAYMIEKRFDPFSILLYSGSLLLAALAFQFLSLAVGLELRRVQGDQAALEQHRLEAWKGWVSFSMYMAGGALSLWHPWLALALLASVTVVWIVPSFGTHKAAALTGHASEHAGRLHREPSGRTGAP